MCVLRSVFVIYRVFCSFVVERVAIFGSSSHHTSMFDCAVRRRWGSLRAGCESPTLVCSLRVCSLCACSLRVCGVVCDVWCAWLTGV